MCRTILYGLSHVSSVFYLELTAMNMGVNSLSLRSLARELGVSHEQVRKWLIVLGYRGYRDWLEATGLRGIDYVDYILRTFLVLRRLGVRYSVLPPISKDIVVPWPWFTVNIFNIDVLGSYIDAYRSIGARIEFVLLDCGVDRYWQRRYEELPLDYDDAYWSRFWEAVDKLRSFAKEAGFSYEITVPDYPDDYSSAWRKKHALWLEDCSDTPTNIDRTLENIAKLIDQDPRIPWLIPAQGYEDAPQSIYFSVKQLQELGLVKRYRIGVANLCTSRSGSIILETVRLAREACPECQYHIFGPGLNGVRKLFEAKLFCRGDSWDSFGYTWPRVPGIGKTQDVYERIKWFCIYLKRIHDVLRYAGIL